jgi:hypothetical protein
MQQETSFVFSSGLANVRKARKLRRTPKLIALGRADQILATRKKDASSEQSCARHPVYLIDADGYNGIRSAGMVGISMKMKFVILFLTGMGMLFAGVSYFTFTSSRNLVEGGKIAEGTVTQLSYSISGSSSSHSSSGSYYPVVRFQTASGEMIEETSRFGSNPPEFKVQDKIRVLYKESDPKDWKVDSFWDLYFLPLMFGIFGGGLLIAATITAVVTRRGAKDANYISYSQRRE